MFGKYKMNLYSQKDDTTYCLFSMMVSCCISICICRSRWNVVFLYAFVDLGENEEGGNRDGAYASINGLIENYTLLHEHGPSHKHSPNHSSHSRDFIAWCLWHIIGHAICEHKK